MITCNAPEPQKLGENADVHTRADNGARPLIERSRGVQGGGDGFQISRDLEAQLQDILRVQGRC